MIEIKNLTKVYPGKRQSVTVLDDVSVTVAAGEIYGILGRSGAGKTTLLRCINQLETPTSGEIWIDGRLQNGLTAKQLRAVRRQVGVVFQHFNLLGARTVAQNVAFPLEIAGIPKPERAARVAELLDLVGLAGHADSYPSQLSGGQKQRVGIARALAGDPKVLLLDEATSALDAETTSQILDLVADINDKLGLTVVLITHEMDVVRRICDSAALLEAGRVVEAGRLIDLVDEPGSRLAELLAPKPQVPRYLRRADRRDSNLVTLAAVAG